MRRARDQVKRLEVPLYFLTAVLGVYLAGGNVLRGAKVPNEAAWSPLSVWFIGLLVCAVYVPLYALYKALDAYLETKDRKAAQTAELRQSLDHDLDLVCQQAAAAIASRCPALHINDIATHVWLCREDGSFERRGQFFLPHLRKRSGIAWRRGKGVAGLAWEANRDLAADLRALHQERQRLGPADFDALPAPKRYGMTSEEFEAAGRYTGIVAIRLFSTEAEPKLLAMFVIDYIGTTEFDCVAAASREREVASLLGGCERRLTEALRSDGGQRPADGAQ